MTFWGCWDSLAAGMHPRMAHFFLLLWDDEGLLLHYPYYYYGALHWLSADCTLLELQLQLQLQLWAHSPFSEICTGSVTPKLETWDWFSAFHVNAFISLSTHTVHLRLVISRIIDSFFLFFCFHLLQCLKKFRYSAALRGFLWFRNIFIDWNQFVLLALNIRRVNLKCGYSLVAWC